MRHALLLVVALLTPASLRAADPPIVFQTQPIGRILDDARSALGHIGGEKLVKEFNDELKRSFGEKALEGLDLTRPIVGYSVLAPKLEQSATIIALPITGEADFLALCERANKSKPKPLPGGLYELPKTEFADKLLMRIQDGHAFLCSANDPTPYLDAKAIVSPNTLFDPAELALASGKVYFDRLPKEVREKGTELVAQAKKLREMPGFGAQEHAILGLGMGFLKPIEQYILQGRDAKELALRLNFDGITGEVATELRLTAASGSTLDKSIAAIAPTANRFGSLITPDTAVGVKVRVPLFTDEQRASVVSTLEVFKKEATKFSQPGGKAAGEELFNGLIRAAKTSDLDFVAAVRGPDKAGLYSLVAALSFEDAAAFDKAFRKFVETDGKPPTPDMLKLDAGKVGDVAIHELLISPGGFLNPQQMFGKEKGSISLAFAPKGLFLVLGADSVNTMKDVLNAKPAAGPLVDVVLNPARLVKMVGHTTGDPQAPLMAEKVLGNEDKLSSLLSLSVVGGKDLRVTLKTSAKTLPRMIFNAGARAEATFEKVEPGVIKK